MQIDKQALGCFVAILVAGVIILAGIFIGSKLEDILADRDQAAVEREYAIADQYRALADVQRARAETEEARAQHRETMLILTALSLAAFTGGLDMMDLFMLAVIAVVAIGAGYYLGLWKKPGGGT